MAKGYAERTGREGLSTAQTIALLVTQDWSEHNLA